MFFCTSPCLRERIANQRKRLQKTILQRVARQIPCERWFVRPRRPPNGPQELSGTPWDVSWGPLGRSLGALGTLLGTSWALWGRCWGVLGRSELLLEDVHGDPGRTRPILAPFWTLQELILDSPRIDLGPCGSRWSTDVVTTTRQRHNPDASRANENNDATTDRVRGVHYARLETSNSIML